MFMCNVIMVAENITILVTQLLTFTGPCSHMKIRTMKRETLHISLTTIFTAF
jgi:hypothetical protein